MATSLTGPLLDRQGVGRRAGAAAAAADQGHLDRVVLGGVDVRHGRRRQGRGRGHSAGVLQELTTRAGTFRGSAHCGSSGVSWDYPIKMVYFSHPVMLVRLAHRRRPNGVRIPPVPHYHRAKGRSQAPRWRIASRRQGLGRTAGRSVLITLRVMPERARSLVPTLCVADCIRHTPCAVRGKRHTECAGYSTAARASSPRSTPDPPCDACRSRCNRPNASCPAGDRGST